MTLRPFLLFVLLAPKLANADALVGEWSIDAPSCDHARLTYTAEGLHEALMLEGGTWKTMASGTYSRDGDRVRVQTGEQQHDDLVIIRADDRTLELRNADAARMQAMGMDSVTLVRCPPR